MFSTSSITSEKVLKALSAVQDPDLHKDLVSLGMIQGLEVDSSSGTVRFRVVLTTPACPLKAKIEEDCRKAVSVLPGVKKVEIKMDAEVRKVTNAPSAGAPGAGGGVRSIEGVAHIIAVSSGKGGVGKSTVAVNLATALALEGAKVGLMDADVYGPNIPTMMGVTEEPFLEKHPIRGELFVPPTAYGVKVMSMGFLVKDDQPMVWRGPMLHSVVSQFCYQVNWGQLDYLIVDMPPGTGDVQLSLAQLVPVSGAVMVSTPQEISMQDVRKALHMFEKVRIPVAGIVENMSYFQVGSERHYLFGQGGGLLLAKKFNLPLLAEIPIFQGIREGGDQGRPIVVASPDSPMAGVFRELARKVAQRIAIADQEGVHPSQIVQIGKFN